MTDNKPSPSETDEAEQPTFDILPLSKEVRRAIDELGYTHPTPVQKAVFETASSGRDLVVQARTGTGKTAAFGLPVVDRLVDLSQKAPQVLILSPTRELALQINREIENIAKHKGVTCTAVYGGASMQPQVDAIRRGVQVIAGTPGRVLDHLERGTLNPGTISALVLDESDEMLSMGFLPQITRIMEQLPTKHQTLLFSATLPADVRRIAETRLKDPEFITLSGDHIGALSIDHFVYRSAGNKSDELIQVLEIENPESAIIFCNTKDQTKRISNALRKQGFASDWLNADLAQNDREKVMKATREGKLRFLVCTDVAARGIDISHLTHVINADFPESTENYVHRTGRTGRAGKTGTAISLIAPQDVGNLYMLRLTYKIFPKERDLPSAGDLQTRKETDLVQFLYQAFKQQRPTSADLSIARRILTSDVAETIVAGLVRDHLGGHPNADAAAAEARRADMPPPVEEELREKKDKKSKKKDGKGEKSGKEKKRDKKPKSDEESFDAASEPVRAPAPRSSEPRQVEARHAEPRQSEARHAEPRQSEARHAEPRQAAARSARPTGNARDSEFEVVSAASLLNAEDLALLQGENEASERSRKPGPARPPAQRGEGPRPASAKVETGAREAAADDGIARIFVDVGKRDDIYKDDFFDALTKAGFKTSDVAFISIRETHSFVGVPDELLAGALKALDGREVGGLEVSAEKARPRRNDA